MAGKDLIRWFFSPWVVGGAVIIALVLLFTTLGLLLFTRPEQAQKGIPTAILNVVAASTATQTQATEKPTANPTSSLPVPPSPLPGVIEPGAYVQIKGTEGDGLRLRVDPGLDSPVRVLGAEDEVFQVKDGPRQAGGFTWWYLVGPYDSTRRGWAVSNYLAVVQNP
jgi:hypothetical protein